MVLYKIPWNLLINLWQSLFWNYCKSSLICKREHLYMAIPQPPDHPCNVCRLFIYFTWKAVLKGHFIVPLVTMPNKIMLAFMHSEHLTQHVKEMSQQALNCVYFEEYRCSFQCWKCHCFIKRFEWFTSLRFFRISRTLRKYPAESAIVKSNGKQVPNNAIMYKNRANWFRGQEIYLLLNKQK